MMQTIETTDRGGAGAPVLTNGTTGNVYTKKYLRAAWNYTEPEPVGSCKGFEVRFFTGADPDSGVLVLDPVFVTAADREVVRLAELRSQVLVNAAVRAIYTDNQKSAWMVSGPVNFLPSTKDYDSTSGWVKMPDGTMMQWCISPSHSEVDQAFSVTWPVPFPNKCHIVIPNAENVDGSHLTDAWYQILSYDTQGARLYRQASTTGAAGHPTRAHILAIGF